MAAARYHCMWASTADRDRSLEVVSRYFEELMALLPGWLTALIAAGAALLFI